MIASTIAEALKAIGCEGCEHERDQYSEDDYPQYNVMVPRDRLATAQEKLWDVRCENFSVRLHQITPPLVGAEPGQLVRIYCERETEDDESAVGIVTSKQVIDGQTVYGCSYIQIALGNSYVNDIYAFHLTQENYGGYHPGFLKVIDAEELTRAVEKMIADGHKKAVERADSMRDTALRGLPEFVATLQKGKTNQVTRWNLDEEDTPSGISVNLAMVRVPKSE